MQSLNGNERVACEAWDGCGCDAAFPARLHVLLERLATDLGVARGEFPESWRLQRCAELMEALLIHATPSAASLVAEGLALGAALDWCEAEGLRQRRLLRI